MSSSGKTGRGRGNNRKKPFRRRENDNESWQKGDFTGRRSDRQIMRPETGAEQAPLPKKTGDRGEKSYFERPKWTPPKMRTDPLPVCNCPWCGKPIRDISSAIADKDSGVPVHFDCVIARITFGEKLEKGDTVTYIGAGRFGIISFGSSWGSSGHYPKNSQNKTGFPAPGHLQKGTSPDHPRVAGPGAGSQTPGRGSSASGSLPVTHDFTIKKIIEWENTETRVEWRSAICDHYSVT